jgi:hypothetical protein
MLANGVNFSDGFFNQLTWWCQAEWCSAKRVDSLKGPNHEFGVRCDDLIERRIYRERVCMYVYVCAGL